MILRPEPKQLTKRQKRSNEPSEERIEILEVFAGLPDRRRKKGKRHQGSLCLALFTLAVVAGNRGFLAIGDWLKSYEQELIALFKPERNRENVRQLVHPNARTILPLRHVSNIMNLIFHPPIAPNAMSKRFC